MATSAQPRRRSSEGATRARGSPASPARRGSATTRSYPGGRRPPCARELCLRAPGGAAAARRPPGEEHHGQGRPLRVMGSAPRPLARPAVGYWSPAEAEGSALVHEPAPNKPLKLPHEASWSSQRRALP